MKMQNFELHLYTKHATLKPHPKELHLTQVVCQEMLVSRWKMHKIGLNSESDEDAQTIKQATTQVIEN